MEEQGHWETVAEYPETGGKDVQWVVDAPGVEAREAWDEEETYWLYIPYTEEELAQMEADRNRLRGGAGEGAGGSAGAAVVRRNGGDGG